jgi:transposase
MKALSLDLRQRIAEAYQRGEGSAAALARRFDVGHRTVQRLLARLRYGEGLAPRPHSGGRRRALSDDDERFIERLLDHEPDLTQEGLVERLRAERGVRVSRTPVRAALRRLTFTYKKRPSSRPNA